MTDATSRRALLSATASLVSTGLAGCLGDGSSPTSTPTDSASGALDTAQSDTGTDTDTDTPTPASATTDDGETRTRAAASTTGTGPGTAGSATPTPGATSPTATASEETQSSVEDAPRWQRALLSNALEDETFRITDFRGSKVVLEMFAVWCPACTDQQENLNTLTQRNDDIVVVSLNIDPNEDDDQVQSHAEEHGFDWRYAVAPSEVTQSLIDQFGRQIAVAPSAPVVRICPDGEAAMVESSSDGAVKLPDDILASFDSC